MLSITYGTYTKKKWACYYSIVILYLLSTPLLSDQIFRFTEDYAVKKSLVSIKRADAIVVLSGMISYTQSDDGLVEEWGDPDRFFSGIDLIKSRKAQKIIFTRALLPWSKSKTSEGEVLKKVAISHGVSETSILLTNEVGNTKDEAAAVKVALAIDDPEVILVTSAYHMQRAKKLFEREGIRVIPYPVDFKVSVDNVTPMDFLPSPAALMLTDIAVREIIGRIYYVFFN